MFATVIPLLRTPLGVEEFDYAIPEGLDVRPGMLVRIPFRKREQLALVSSIHTKSAFADRTVELIGIREDVVFPEAFLELLERTAVYTFSSKPSMLKAWLRQIPKRESAFRPVYKTPSATKASAVWITQPENRLMDIAREVSTKKRLLILTPWKHRAESFSKQLGAAPFLTSDLAAGAAFRAWQEFLCKKNGVLISTRIGAWLAPLSDVVLIDEPENDDHKSDELSPRYDARKLALWSKSASSVTAFGLTPPLHVHEEAPAIPCPLDTIIRHPKGYSTIPFIQADALNLLREHPGPKVVIHGVRGEASRFTCRDCGWTAVCPNCQFSLSFQNNEAICRRCGFHEPPPATCRSCGGADLGKALPGIDRLQKVAAKEEPDLELTWRSTIPSELEQPLPEHCRVLVTDPNFLASAGGEDIRRDERNAIAFRRLADRVAAAQGMLIVQTQEDGAGKWSDWLSCEGYAAWKTHELIERETFRYPPTVTLVKAIVTGTETEAEAWAKRAKQHLGESAELRGPFPVPFRTKTTKPRFIWHLLPWNMTESALISALTPLASSAIIDLDPIAFFR